MRELLLEAIQIIGEFAPEAAKRLLAKVNPPPDPNDGLGSVGEEEEEEEEEAQRAYFPLTFAAP